MELDRGYYFNQMTTYKKELIRAMNYLAKDKKTLFLGQSVSYPGNSMYNTLVDVPKEQKIELPVFEEVQMGIAIGLALEGFLPVTCYPRFDFLILALNQMLNHLDKIRTMSRNEIKLKVIIRTSVGSKTPLDGGVQHTQDYTDAMRLMCKEIKVIKLFNKQKIFKTFQNIKNDKKNFSYLIIEDGDEFNKE